MDAQRTPDECEPIKPSMSRIGLVAYCALPPNLVFVRVPNEAGRWVMVHRCVVDLDCAYCGAVAGEPCHNRKANRRYGVGTHTARRYAYRGKYKYQADIPKHKPRISATDLEAANHVI